MMKKEDDNLQGYPSGTNQEDEYNLFEKPGSSPTAPFSTKGAARTRFKQYSPKPPRVMQFEEIGG